jgi:hypothetical protein
MIWARPQGGVLIADMELLEGKTPPAWSSFQGRRSSFEFDPLAPWQNGCGNQLTGPAWSEIVRRLKRSDWGGVPVGPGRTR